VPTFNYKAVEVQAIPSNDILAAIKSKNVDCGILLDPIWVSVKDDPTFVQVATQTPGEPLGLMAYGKRLLQDRKDIGDAFARAYIRTVNTYYQGDYHKDAKVMAEIQKFTGQSDAVFQPLAALDSLTMDWEIRKDTTTRVQQLFATPTDQSPNGPPSRRAVRRFAMMVRWPTDDPINLTRGAARSANGGTRPSHSCRSRSARSTHSVAPPTSRSARRRSTPRT
jgi:ABC-type nitrate/sulfonate/bicarbonate transport system substrate-binding protein